MSANNPGRNVWQRLAARLCAAVALHGLVAALPAAAQDYPTRPVRIVVPFPAGGTADAVPRIVGEYPVAQMEAAGRDREPRRCRRQYRRRARLQGGARRLHAAVVAAAAARHQPEPLCRSSISIPTQFVPIINMVRVPNALVVTPKFPPKTVAEVIDYARANPGKINAATQGNGTTSHLTTELFQLMANVKLQNVPYTGSAPALNDLVAGNVEIMFDNLGVSLALVKADKLRLIAVATAKRLASLPDVPDDRRDAAGLRIGGLVCGRGAAEDARGIVNKINADINEALRQPEMPPHFANWSAEADRRHAEETAAYMREEVERWNKVIKAAGMRIE